MKQQQFQTDLLRCCLNLRASSQLIVNNRSGQTALHVTHAHSSWEPLKNTVSLRKLLKQHGEAGRSDTNIQPRHTAKDLQITKL
jgi:hypothetical protein